VGALAKKTALLQTSVVCWFERFANVLFCALGDVGWFLIRVLKVANQVSKKSILFVW